MRIKMNIKAFMESPVASKGIDEIVQTMRINGVFVDEKEASMIYSDDGQMLAVPCNTTFPSHFTPELAGYSIKMQHHTHSMQILIAQVTRISSEQGVDAEKRGTMCEIDYKGDRQLYSVVEKTLDIIVGVYNDNVLKEN